MRLAQHRRRAPQRPATTHTFAPIGTILGYDDAEEFSIGSWVARGKERNGDPFEFTATILPKTFSVILSGTATMSGTWKLVGDVLTIEARIEFESVAEQQDLMRVVLSGVALDTTELKLVEYFEGEHNSLDKRGRVVAIKRSGDDEVAIDGRYDCTRS